MIRSRCVPASTTPLKAPQRGRAGLWLVLLAWLAVQLSGCTSPPAKISLLPIEGDNPVLLDTGAYHVYQRPGLTNTPQTEKLPVTTSTLVRRWLNRELKAHPSQNKATRIVAEILRAETYKRETEIVPGRVGYTTNIIIQFQIYPAGNDLGHHSSTLHFRLTRDHPKDNPPEPGGPFFTYMANELIRALDYSIPKHLVEHYAPYIVPLHP